MWCNFPRERRRLLFGWLALFPLSLFLFRFLLPPPLPPLRSLNALLSKPQVGVAKTKGGFFFFCSIAYLSENSQTTGNTLLQRLKQKPVTRVSRKQMKNESSPVQRPPSQRGWHSACQQHHLPYKECCPAIIFEQWDNGLLVFDFRKRSTSFCHWSKVLFS